MKRRVNVAKKIFSREYLMDELDLPYNAVEEEIIGTSRWSVHYSKVFQDKDGKYYQTAYSVGATECQDERPREYEESVACVEVCQKEVLVRKWVPVKEDQKT